MIDLPPSLAANRHFVSTIRQTVTDKTETGLRRLSQETEELSCEQVGVAEENAVTNSAITSAECVRTSLSLQFQGTTSF